jgi:hypothetical protein
MPGNTDTYAKQKAWHDRKKKKHQKEAAIAAHDANSECTFQPRINASSRVVKSRLVTGVAGEPDVDKAASNCNTSASRWGRSTISGPESEAAVSSHVARQLEARRRRERINSGACFQTKRTALIGGPFHLSRSNKMQSATHVSEKTVASQKQLFERIEHLERENSLLKVKGAKELMVLKEEMLNRSENALQKQARSLMEKHSKDRDEWQAERKLLLELIESFKGELAQREEAKVKAEALAEIIASAVNTLESNVIEIQHHTVEELRLLRGQMNQGGSKGGSGSAIDLDEIRGLFRENEKTVRQLLLGRERSSSEQILKLQEHAKSLSTESSKLQEESNAKHLKLFELHLEQQGSAHTKLETLLSDYHKNSRENWDKVHDGLGTLHKLSNEQHELSHSTLPNIARSLRTLSESDPAMAAKKPPLAESEASTDADSSTGPKEELVTSDVDSTEGVAPPSASSFTGPTENSPGFREDADNVSTTSSMETEWIEVDQPDGKFYFNRYTKEVRKELPTGR